MDEQPQNNQPRKAVCKFTCQSVTKYFTNRGVKLITQYDPNLPEDQKFSKATPSGSMEMTIDNPALEGLFEPGKQYLIEITEVEA